MAGCHICFFYVSYPEGYNYENSVCALREESRAASNELSCYVPRTNILQRDFAALMCSDTRRVGLLCAMLLDGGRGGYRMVFFLRQDISRLGIITSDVMTGTGIMHSVRGWTHSMECAQIIETPYAMSRYWPNAFSRRALLGVEA